MRICISGKVVNKILEYEASVLCMNKCLPDNFLLIHASLCHTFTRGHSGLHPWREDIFLFEDRSYPVPSSVMNLNKFRFCTGMLPSMTSKL